MFPLELLRTNENEDVTWPIRLQRANFVRVAFSRVTAARLRVRRFYGRIVNCHRGINELSIAPNEDEKSIFFWKLSLCSDTIIISYHYCHITEKGCYL